MALEREFDYYLAHQNELVKQHSGKVVVIKDDALVGVYGSELEAIRKTSKQFPLGTFLVQKCEPGTAAYTETFHSRVIAS